MAEHRLEVIQSEDLVTNRCGSMLDYGCRIERFCPFPFARVNDGERLFGVELEMEIGLKGGVIAPHFPNIVELLDGPISGKHIIKYDGSLENGLELVTVPMSLAEHREFGWPELLEPALPYMRSGKGTTNCGMHVHINRRALSPLTLGKLLVFLNSDDTDAGVIAVAQRDSNGYATKRQKKIIDGVDEYSEEGRYQRLNLTRHTAEVRIFRGNLRWDRILKNLEFCDAAVEFCGHASMRDVGKWGAFTDWLAANAAHYPLLCEYLRHTRPGQWTKLRRCRVPRKAEVVNDGGER